MSEAFGGDFKLDTKSMSQIATDCEDLAKRMQDIRHGGKLSSSGLDMVVADALDRWHGKGAKAFEKKYHALAQQLSDISEQLYELAEVIRNAEDSYIQADMEAAKQLDGKSSIPSSTE